MLSVDSGVSEFTLETSRIYINNSGYSNDLLFWVSHH